MVASGVVWVKVSTREGYEGTFQGDGSTSCIHSRSGLFCRSRKAPRRRRCPLCSLIDVQGLVDKGRCVFLAAGGNWQRPNGVSEVAGFIKLGTVKWRGWSLNALTPESFPTGFET